MDKKNEIIDKVVKAYFKKPDKTLEEIFKEYTKGFSDDKRRSFYKKLKEIVN